MMNNDKETINHNVALFKQITQEMADLYKRKNADYGDSFSKSIDEFGFGAALVRISDKFNRAKQLLLVQQGQYINDESVSDTLTDFANYAIMLRIEIENRKTRNSEERVTTTPVQLAKDIFKH